MRDIKLIVFDLDGVVVDTAKLHCAAWRTLLWEKFQVYHTDQVDEMTKGVGRYDCMALIAHQYDIQADEATLHEIADQKNERYQQLLRDELCEDHVLPGVRETLALIAEKNLPTALASSSHNAPFIVQALNLHFDYCVNPGAVQHGKPAPDIYLAAAQHFGIPPAQCIGIEDAVSGVEAVKEAQMYCIGVGPKALLHRADTLVDSTAQIPALLEKLLA